MTFGEYRNAANYVSETVQGATSTASKEANKNVAKDSDARLSTRVQAAGDMVGDKVDEETHNVSQLPNTDAQYPAVLRCAYSEKRMSIGKLLSTR